MNKSRLLGAVCACILSISAQAVTVSMSTPDQNGVSITTILDTDNHQLTYVFDFSSLPYDYENIAFSPSPLPAFDAIPLQSGAVTSAGSTEWNFHQIYDAGVFVDWSLELQYQTGSPPARSNSIVINYISSFQLTGAFLGQAGDDNFQVTYRRPTEGFPDGQEDNITFWVYVPEIQASAVPLPATVWLFGSGLLGLIGMSTRKKAHSNL